MGDVNRATGLRQPKCKVPGCTSEADFFHPSTASRNGGALSDDGSYLCSRHYLARLNSDGRTIPDSRRPA